MFNLDQMEWVLGLSGITINPKTFSAVDQTKEESGKMTTGNRTEKLKYLGVEMLQKDGDKSSSPEVGLFRGIKERSVGKGEAASFVKLILLGDKEKENDMRGLNLDVFNVLSLKMMYGQTKELIVFKSTDIDQKLAHGMLDEAMKEFRAEKKMLDNDPEIVDISQFEEVPAEFFNPKDQEKKTTRGTTNHSNFGNHTGYPTSGTTTTTEWQKKEAERKAKKAKEEKMRWTPTFIKRQGDLPELKVLNAMKKKVTAVTDGKYEVELEDPDPADTFEDKKSKTTTK